MLGSQRALAVAMISLAIIAVGGVASAATMGQRLGIGAGPGYQAGCPTCNGSFPHMGNGCCELPPRWTYQVWAGYECEHPNWWYYGRPRRTACER